MLSKYEKYRLVYSPRTSISNMREREEKLFNDLGIGFEPSTIEIMKKHFKERLGVLNKVTFISIIKRHLNKWHPELCNREEMLVKLLSKLFDQIDLNSNGDMEWNEFMNYIVDSSFQKNFQKASNTIQHYAICKTSLALTSVPGGEEIDKNNLLSNFNQSIAYCFYIQKYKLIGVVHDNKSNISFYNAETNIKEGKEINLIETQDEIDKFEINELDHKTKIMLQKETEKARILFLKQKENIISFRKKNNIKGGYLDLNKKEKQLIKYINKGFLKSKEKERISTPLAISREIRLIKGNNFLNNKKRNVNRKLSTLCTFFVDEYDLLFISSSNNKISAWRYNIELKGFQNVNSSNYLSNNFIFCDSEMKIPIFSSGIPQYTLCFDSIMNKLYSGQEDGKILVWSMISSKCKDYLFHDDTNNNFSKVNINKTKTVYSDNNDTLNLKSERKSVTDGFNSKESEIIARDNRNKQFLNICNKRDTVSCLLMLNKLRLLCASYYNGKVILWDIVTKKPKKIFNEQKTGIYQFVYDPNKNYLYTCGFDHNIYVYDPYNEDSSVYQLKGHNSSVKSISLNLENNELISIDINGNLKIWDTTIFMNFQTLNIYNSLIAEQGHSKKQAEQLVNKKKIMSNIHVLSLSNIKKIIVYGDKFLIYEKGKTKNPNLCDDNLILGCIYNNFQNDLITFSHKRVKLWDIFTGKVKIIFEDPMEGGEITSFAHDIQMKRFYIGDNFGKIKNFNLSTGGYLKSFISHKSEITHMIHSFQYELLITCSNDLVIRFQNDKELTTTEIVKEINLNFLFSTSNLFDHIYLKDVKFNEEDGHLMIGLSNTWISFYDVKHYKYLYLYNAPQETISKTTTISCIEDICNVNIIFVSYENGKKVFMLKPNNKFFHLLHYKKFGNFIDNEYEQYINKDNYKNDDYKGIILSTTYDPSKYNLIVGDHLGFINVYNLNFFNDFMNKNFKNNEEITKYVENNINIKNTLYIRAHKESIKHLSVPQDLKPQIILSTSNDRTVKLFDYKTGEYIDSLKQVSIKYNPIPIAIEYIKNNPFLKDVDEIEKKSKIELYDTESVLKFNELKQIKQKIKFNNNNKDQKNEKTGKIEKILKNEKKEKITNPSPEIDTIFRESVIRKNIRPPEFDIDNIQNNDAFVVSNDILEYNAKVKLHDTSIGTTIPSNRSTLWNYNIDINFILNKNKEDIQELINNINAKENEIVQTEIAYKTNSIYNPNYQPIFLKNLNDNEKVELNNIINDKIKNIKFAISRSQISKCENESIRTVYHFSSPKNKLPKRNVIYNINHQKNIFSYNKNKNNQKFSLTSQGFVNKTINNNRNIDKDEILKINNIGNNTEDNFNNNKLSLKENQLNLINNSKSQKYKLEYNETNNFKPLKTTIGNEKKKIYKKYHDQRIQKCLSQFEEKLNELVLPFALLYRNKKVKKSSLPKINYNIFTSHNIGK